MWRFWFPATINMPGPPQCSHRAECADRDVKICHLTHSSSPNSEKTSPGQSQAGSPGPRLSTGSGAAKIALGTCGHSGQFRHQTETDSQCFEVLWKKISTETISGTEQLLLPGAEQACSGCSTTLTMNSVLTLRRSKRSSSGCLFSMNS